MCKLKLIKGRSYTGYGVKASVKRPCVDVDKKEVADALIASGYFSLVEETAGSNFNGEKPIEKMTEKELDAYAAENGIDLAGVSGKAKKLAKIQDALAADDNGADDGSDLFNDED